jgi:hypothetical protein
MDNYPFIKKKRHVKFDLGQGYNIDYIGRQADFKTGAAWWLIKDGERLAPIGRGINEAKRVLNFVKKKGYLPAEMAQRIAHSKHKVVDY